MSKLCVQVQVNTEPSRTMLRATLPRAVKVMQDGVDRPTLETLAANGLELVVGRYVFGPWDGDNLSVQPRLDKLLAWADENLKWLKDRGVRVVLECPFNEDAQNGDALDKLNQATLKCIPAIAARGYDVGIGVFSEGNPSDFADWGRFHPSLRLAQGFWKSTTTRVFLCVHEYGIPSLGVVDGWHNFRYRKVWPLLPADCKIPILVTESGIDGGIEQQTKKGWRGYMDAKAYQAWLWRTRQELDLDDYVWFSFVFLCGGNQDWTLFDVTDEVDLRPPLLRGGAKPSWVPSSTGGTTPMTDITLSVPMRATHAAAECYGVGPRPTTRGVVIHTTRGGTSTVENEYTATINWFANPASELSAHLVVGSGRFSEVCRCVGDREIAFHARENNATHLSIEIAQAKDGDPISDFQYKAAAEACRLWAAKYKFPLKRVMSQFEAGLIGHEDTEAGKRDGKTDPGRSFDWTKFMALVNTGGTAGGTPVFDFEAVKAQLWAIADQCEKNGHPWFGQGLKALVALAKGEK